MAKIGRPPPTTIPAEAIRTIDVHTRRVARAINWTGLSLVGFSLLYGSLAGAVYGTKLIIEGAGWGEVMLKTGLTGLGVGLVAGTVGSFMVLVANCNE